MSPTEAGKYAIICGMKIWFAIMAALLAPVAAVAAVEVVCAHPAAEKAAELVRAAVGDVRDVRLEIA